MTTSKTNSNVPNIKPPPAKINPNTKNSPPHFMGIYYPPPSATAPTAFSGSKRMSQNECTSHAPPLSQTNPADSTASSHLLRLCSSVSARSDVQLHTAPHLSLSLLLAYFHVLLSVLHILLSRPQERLASCSSSAMNLANRPPRPRFSLASFSRFRHFSLSSGDTLAPEFQ